MNTEWAPVSNHSLRNIDNFTSISVQITICIFLFVPNCAKLLIRKLRMPDEEPIRIHYLRRTHNLYHGYQGFNTSWTQNQSLNYCCLHLGHIYLSLMTQYIMITGSDWSCPLISQSRQFRWRKWYGCTYLLKSGFLRVVVEETDEQQNDHDDQHQNEQQCQVHFVTL